jgi:hypothetical protein
MSEADTTAEVVSEPWRLAAGPGFADTYETDETASAFESAPEQEPTPLAMSEADTTAQVVSEAWRLASGPGFADTIATHEAASTPESASEPEPASGADASADVDSEPAAVGFQFDSPADATLSVSREEVEAALRGPGSDPPHFELGDPGTGLEPMMVDLRPTAPPTEDKIPVFEPPEELESAMTRFNARHVVLFRALRAEIGAGAANFVRSCRTGLDGGFAQMFASADLRADGSWDPEALKRSVIEHRVSNADEGFRQLIDAEIEKLRVHLGETKTGSLADQLASIP